MTAYLDTSALVKLYVREQGSASVRRLVHAEDLVATSRVAYAEARAAFARRAREAQLGPQALTRVVRTLDHDFDSFAVVEVTRELVQRAGALSQTRALRGFDAIHLASALELGALLGALPQFAAYDRRLLAAARAEGLPIARA